MEMLKPYEKIALPHSKFCFGFPLQNLFCISKLKFEFNLRFHAS